VYSDNPGIITLLKRGRRGKLKIMDLKRQLTLIFDENLLALNELASLDNLLYDLKRNLLLDAISDEDLDAIVTICLLIKHRRSVDQS
jgi:hypothetical protein